jgi:cytochrome c oxidase cbb3-type subunit 1
MRRDSLGKMNPSIATKIQNQEYRDALRFPVLMFLGSAVFWLVIGSFLSCLAAWKLVMPSLLDGSGWLTYGRIQAAAENSLWYGWVSQAGMGFGFWLLAQLGRSALGSEKLLVTAGAFWNFGLLLGICGILAGDGNALRGLEFPGPAAAVLLVAYVCIGVWSLILLRDRSRDGLYVSQWYLLAAFLCFPWLYATANMLLIWYPVQGSAQGPIASWFFGALLWLWLGSLVLGTVYYLVPHFAQRPVRAYPSSVLAFWLLAFFGGWMGVRQLIGGPVPAWMVSASVAANIMMLIPATIIGINTFGTLSARTQPHRPDVLFTIVGLACFACVVLQGAATPVLAVITHFSDYTSGEHVVFMLGFLSMTLFGAFYYVVPRLTGADFSSRDVSWHFWLFIWGAGTMFVCLTLGGLIQGFAFNDSNVNFMSSLSLVFPFRVMSALGAVAVFAGTIAFAMAFVRNLLDSTSVPEPTPPRLTVTEAASV